MLLIVSGAMAYLLIVTAIMCRPTSALGPEDDNYLFVEFHTGIGWPCGPLQWEEGSGWSSFDPEYSTGYTGGQTTTLLWTKSIRPANLWNEFHNLSYNIPDGIHDYVVGHNAGISLLNIEDTLPCFGREGVPSNRDVCAPRYYCLMRQILQSKPSDYITCLGRFNITREQEDSSTWACHFKVRPRIRTESCASGYWDLNKANWDRSETDEQLKIALQGGVDNNGLYWEGTKGEPLAESFVDQFWDIEPGCTLKNPCQNPLDCSSVGSFTANLGSSIPYQSRWVYFATAALVNINRQLRNQYDELKDAIQSLALDAFSIDEFFPTKSQDVDLSNSLTGLSGIFSILGGFVPVAGPFISAAGTIASGVGKFLENSVAAASSDDPLAAQKIFSKKVSVFYNASLEAMENLVTELFEGKPIPGPGPGSFTLLDMVEGGAWVDPRTLTSVSSLNEKIKREILARSIDSLWKSRTEEQTIKMWVLFTDLSNDSDSTECVESKSRHSRRIR